MCENKNKKFCPVIATINTDIQNKSITVIGQHNHSSRKVNIEVPNLKKIIGVKSTNIDSLNIAGQQIPNQEIVP